MKPSDAQGWKDWGKSVSKKINFGTSNQAAEPGQKLERRDKLGLLGEVATTVGSGVGGSALAAMAGGTVIFGTFILASAPVIIAGGVGGLAFGYALSKVLQSGGRADYVRRKLLRAHERKAPDSPAKVNTEAELQRLEVALSGAVASGFLDKSQAARMLVVCRERVRSVEWAFVMLNDLVRMRDI